LKKEFKKIQSQKNIIPNAKCCVPFIVLVCFDFFRDLLLILIGQL